MSVYLVVLCYGAAAVAALLLLYRFEPTRWIWHVLSLCLALAVGLVQLPERLSSPAGTLAVGSLFVLLFFWGAFAPFFRKYHYHARC
jgi:hypothetical protein